MIGLIWIHEWIANSGVLDRFLAGDLTINACIGVLIGAWIAPQHFKRLMEKESGDDRQRD